MLNFCDFIQVFVFTTNHHLKIDCSFIVFIVTLIYQNITDALQRVCNQIIQQFWGLIQACFSVELFAGISMVLVLPVGTLDHPTTNYHEETKY